VRVRHADVTPHSLQALIAFGVIGSFLVSARAENQESPSQLGFSALVRRVPTLLPELTVSEVSENWFRETHWEALAIVKHGLVLGLVTRRKLSQTLFTRFGHSLFGNKPIIELAQRDASVVSIAMSRDEVVELALKRPESDSFDDMIAVDEQGQYAGLLSVKDLVLRQTDDLANVRSAKLLAEARRHELERMSALKSNFLAHVTHELRSPVNIIAGLAELIELGYAGGEQERLGQHIGVLRKSARHLRALSNNVLDLAKLEAGKAEVQREEFSAHQLLSEVADATRILTQEDSVKVEVELSVADISLFTDHIKVRQILTNLASNAAKFTTQGTIAFKLWGDAERVVFRVCDTGVGVAAADQAELFQAFSQVGDVDTRQHAGTGLGLVISRNLALVLGGELEFKSELNVGTEVTLRLPKRFRATLRPEENAA